MAGIMTNQRRRVKDKKPQSGIFYTLSRVRLWCNALRH